MDRSAELFDRLKNKGMAAIDEFIDTRASEELFLDFKRSSDHGASKHLSQTDRNNLAKAISGFGNSEGGVIVWGIDCSTDFDGTDVAKAKFPIENIQRFLGNLQGAVSGCTIPPHSKVEHHAIPCEDGKGYVGTLIPKSDYAPHQMVGKLQYYIRAGSDFVPAPHQVLAGMFGKRPQPNVFNMYIIEPAQHVGHDLIFKYGIVITNKGPGIARDLYFSCMTMNAIGSNTQVSWELTDKVNWTGNFSFGRQISIISNVDVRLPPECHLQPLVLNIKLTPPFDSSLEVKGSVGCGGAPSYKLEIDTPVVRVTEIYEQYFNKLKSGNLDNDSRNMLASKLINSPLEEGSG